ncbi:hypothetical protein J6P52_02970 [bacterium]|nr:hypothetical protein [bacterium]
MKSTYTKLSEDNFNVIAFDENDEFNTVLDHFKKSLFETKYDYESDLEKDFIKKLQSLGYEYSQIHNYDELLKNLKIQLEKLNKITFNDNE